MQVNSQYNYELGMGVNVHQDSALSPLLFIRWRRPNRPSSWFLVLAMLSSRNLTSTPVLPALGLSATTQSSAHSACGGSTRSAVASLSKQLVAASNYVCPGVRVRLGLSLAELWMSMAPCLMWKPLSATYVISCAPVPLLPDVVWPGESSGNSCLF